MSRSVLLIPIVVVMFGSANLVVAQPRPHVTPWEPRTQPVGSPPVGGKSPAIPISTTTWTPIGPQPLNSNGSSGNVSGRISGIAVDPTNANTIYVSPAGGGVWKTTNGGTNWTPLTDSQVTLSMGAIAVAPSNPSVIYAGTGESNNSLDSNFGRGILVSTNGGATWALTGPAVWNTDRVTVGRIAVDPTNSAIAYAAIADLGNNGVFPAAGATGIWKTTNTGGSWTNMTAAFGLDSSGPWTDVQMDTTFGTLFAARGWAFGGSFGNPNGVYKSTDGGATWGLLPTFPNGASAGRIAIAVAPFIVGGIDRLYVSVSNPATSGLLSLRRSDDGGATSVDLTANPGMGNYMGGQGWYDTVVSVDPTNSAVVIVAGAASSSSPGSILRSADSGATWANITAGAVRPHADHHAGVFVDIGEGVSAYFDGDDGGIYRLDDPTTPVWTDINGNLGTIQFTGLGLHPTDPNQVIGGSQDNGTEKFSGSLTWSETDGGDGGFAKFSQTNGNIVYHQIPNASFGTNFFRFSGDGGLTWVTHTAGISADVNLQQFYAPFVVDPGNGDRVLYGTNGVWETINEGVNWTKLPAFPVAVGFVNAIGLAPSTVNTIYAAVHSATGPNSGFGPTNVFFTNNHGATWTMVNTGLPADGIVQDIQVDPATPATAYAVLSNFSAGGNVFKTTNGGTLWTNISGNLAAVTACACALPVWSFQIDNTAGKFYIAADDGVYVSSDGGTTWSRFGAGLPDAQVFQIELNKTLNILGAATHGRSAWEISTAPATAPDFLITKTHTDPFTQGQIGATYTITVKNTGTAATSGLVTVSDTVPAGLTPTSIAGAGWVCMQPSGPCTRSDALAGGLSYPPITLTVNVSPTAPPTVINSASVTGGGVTADADDTANDLTNITPVVVGAPDFLITKTHTDPFTQGQIGATYTITVKNTGTAATSGLVTVTDTVPAGLTPTSIAGAGWACTQPSGPCTRSDALAGGLSYPPITLTVDVSPTAPPTVINSASVTGGGVTADADDTANDPTTIIPRQTSPLSVQISYSSNLSFADSAVNISNTGASASATNPVTQALNGNMCVNVYTFSPDEQLISCCSCHVTPNALWSLSARNDLVSNTLTPGVPTSVVVKLVATLAGPLGASGPGPATNPTCGTAASVAGSTAFPIAPGLAAWSTTVHALGSSAVLPTGGTIPPPGTTLTLTETGFTVATLSAAELSRINTLCGFIQGNGSGFGICKSCRFGGLTGVQQ